MGPYDNLISQYSQGGRPNGRPIGTPDGFQRQRPPMPQPNGPRPIQPPVPNPMAPGSVTPGQLTAQNPMAGAGQTFPNNQESWALPYGNKIQPAIPGVIQDSKYAGLIAGQAQPLQPQPPERVDWQQQQRAKQNAWGSKIPGYQGMTAVQRQGARTNYQPPIV